MHADKNKDKSIMNSVKKDKTQNETIYIAIVFFFSSCVPNLVLKILGNANTHLVNIHRFGWIFFIFSIFLTLVSLNFKK
jgi:hypothetical protein